MKENLFSLLSSFDKNEISRSKAESRLASFGRRWLKRDLAERGLSPEFLPDNPKLLSGILLSTREMGETKTRIDGPKTMEGVINGTLYLSDAANIIDRFAFRRDDKIEVWNLIMDKEKPGFSPECSMDASAVPDELSEPVPSFFEEDIGTPGLQPPEDPFTFTADLPISNFHYKADLKAVFWIPYLPNDFPLLNRFMREPLKSATMPQSMRMALRGMFATGNPPPPDSFTDAEWTAFKASKEFRGLHHVKLVKCCDDDSKSGFEVVEHMVGFTPPPSNVPENQLVQDHISRQDLGSIAEGLISQGGALSDQLFGIPGFAVEDDYEDALALIKQIARPNPNESYSKGEELFGSKKYFPKGLGCIVAEWSHFLRVGKVNNLLFFMLTGKLLAYQGARILAMLCCPDGKLRIAIKHSAIPSFKIYLDGKKWLEYDMFTATYNQIEGCVFREPEATTEFSSTALKRGLEKNKISVLGQSLDGDKNLTKLDGCPESL